MTQYVILKKSAGMLHAKTQTVELTLSYAMMIQLKHKNRGFALIATMAIMSLVVLISVGSITLSKGVSKESNNLRYKHEAQSNARMALMIALGELQKELGPDQRISANMAVFAGNPETAGFDAESSNDGYENPHYLGVWNSWTTWLSGDNDPSEIAETYDRGRTSNFRKLLVSHPDSKNMSSDQWRDFAESGSGNLDTVALVSTGSLGPQGRDSDRVTAPLINTENGRYAWYVSGNNQKANVSLGKEERGDSLADSAAASSNVTANGLNRNLDNSVAGYPINQNELNKVVSSKSAQLLADSTDFFRSNFHAFTNHSSSILTNVRDGGLKKDLNLLLELSDPADQMPKGATLVPELDPFAVKGKYGYTAQGYDSTPKPIRRHEGYFGQNDESLLTKHLWSWQRMAAFYKEYKESGNPSKIQSELNKYGNNSIGMTKAPIIAAIYYQFGVYPIDNEAWITYNPVLVLWNPYNTPLKVPPTWVNTNWNNVHIRAFHKDTGDELFQWQRMMNHSTMSNVEYADKDEDDKRQITTWAGTHNSTSGTTGGMTTWSSYQGFTLEAGESRIMSVAEKLANGTPPTSMRGNMEPTYHVGNDYKRGIRVKINPLNDPTDPSGGYFFDNPANNIADYRLEISFSRGSLDTSLHPRPDLADSNYPGSGSSDGDGYYVSQIRNYSPISSYNAARDKDLRLTDPAGVPFDLGEQFLTIGYVLKPSGANLGSGDIVPRDMYNKSFVHSNPGNRAWQQGESVVEEGQSESGTNSRFAPVLAGALGEADFEFNKQVTPTSMSKIGQYHFFVVSGIGATNSIDLDNTNPDRGVIFEPRFDTSVSTMEIPTSPMYSIGAFQTAPIEPATVTVKYRESNPSTYGRVKTALSGGINHYPKFDSALGMKTTSNTAFTIANSFANPLIPSDKIYQDNLEFTVVKDYFNQTGNAAHINTDYSARYTYDHSYILNDALFDEWFCSSITPQKSNDHFGTSRSLSDVVSGFTDGDRPLPNQHLKFSDEVLDADQFGDIIGSGSRPQDDAFEFVAQGLSINGGFNVNTTSVEAWKAFFNGLRGSSFQVRSPDTGRLSNTAVDDDKIVVSRMSIPLSSKEGRDAQDPASWQGVRYLTKEQIDKLAEECVRQVKLRGPFLNMSDFVNRRLDNRNEELSRVGALQAAIDWDEFNGNQPNQNNPSSINARYKDEMLEAFEDHDSYPSAHIGSKWTAIPGYVIQGDLLKRIGNQITVRDDTFTIRAYGESTDSKGRVRSSAYCEAVVQRGISYVDDSEEPTLTADQINNEDNKLYGRKMSILSFRWLSSDEI